MARRAKGLAPTTVENSYGYPLRGVLLPWCAERDMTDVVELTDRQLDAFSVSVQEQPGRRGQTLSKHSVHAYLRGVRGFLAWAQREGEAVKASRRCRGCRAASSTSAIRTRSSASSPPPRVSGTG